MKCPYCKREIHAMTGFQEIQKFNKHLPKCRKNPNNIVITDGWKKVVVPKRAQSMIEALEIRAGSGQ